MGRSCDAGTTVLRRVRNIVQDVRIPGRMRDASHLVRSTAREHWTTYNGSKTSGRTRLALSGWLSEAWLPPSAFAGGCVRLSNGSAQ